MQHPDSVLPELVSFLGIEVSAAARQCVAERIRAMSVGVQPSVCSPPGCGQAHDAMQDDDVDEVQLGHSRGLRTVSGLIEQATPAFPFKWLDLVTEDVWSDFVGSLMASGWMREMLSELGYWHDLQGVEEYILNDPTWTWWKARKETERQTIREPAREAPAQPEAVQPVKLLRAVRDAVRSAA